MRFLLLLAASATLYAQSCTYSPNPNAFITGAGSGGSGLSDKFVVSTQSGCAWTATANVPWIHITNAQTYIGPQTVTFTLDQNTSSQIRTGTITVGDQTTATQQTVNFTQIAGNCNYQITPPLSANFPIAGGSGTFQVTAGCGWTSYATQNWINETAPQGAVLGNGSVTYTVAANGCVAGRSAAIVVNTGVNVPPPPTLTVNQDGSPANLTLSPTTASFGPGTGTGRVTVSTGDGCPWSSFTDASWVQVTSGTGSGNGTSAITFTVLANVGPTRTGHITVGAQVFMITQTSAVATAPVLSAIVNSASGAAGPVSPGEIVSLFGTGMGPTTGVPFNNSITTNLGGVQVMFGNVAAPLTYVSATQINAIVPYGIAGNASTQVQVQYQGQSSNSMTAVVQSATPAIFSADMSGHGPGAILNGDAHYTLNSGANPISRGGVVMIYGTGGGTTNPASADGSLAPSAEPFPRLTLPVTVTIGGAPAQVAYAGGAPGLVAGLLQINVIVPVGIATGQSVPVLVQIGSWQSQAGITLAVQ
jgi:uncharacterized protein (TIGR03437 family)